MSFQAGKAIVLLLLLPITLSGQERSLSADTLNLPEKKEEKIFKPTIGLGTGMFSYFGDVGSAGYRSPLISRIGYELNVGKDLNKFLELNFHVLFGKLSGNERSVTRNLNFQSEIRAGGLSLVYNFHHLLPETRNTEPWISVGVESFEFLSKTDLYDANGNYYYFWDDGAIKNLPQDDPNANQAVYLQRDYTYETDIRTSNADGFGKYPERSFSVPVGAGMRFKLSEQVKFKVGSTMHFAFTDMVDGVSAESQGNRQGDSRDDWFLMTSASLSYDFMIRSKAKEFEIPEDHFDDVDFLAMDTDDEDQDQVRDWDDHCAGTPPGVKVDERGCPLDDDLDGVPNYRDDELTTPSSTFVNQQGEQLTDSMIAHLYEVYMDSTGKFAKVIKREREDFTSPNGGGRTYMVQVGRFTTGIPPELINKFLSIPDVTTRNENDSVTLYLVGKYPTNYDATRRMQELKTTGLEGVVVEEINGQIRGARPDLNLAQNTGNNQNTNQNTGNQNTNNVGNNTGNQTGNNNQNTGNQTNNQNNTGNQSQNNTGTQTQNNQNNTTNNTANQNNQNNQNSGNGTQITQYNDNSFTASDPANTVVFRVQLGAFKKRLSKDIFGDAGNIVEVTADDGLVKYLSGSFTNYNQAAGHKVDMLVKGFRGAFVVAYKNGKRISLTEAGATLAPKEQPANDNEDPENLIDKSLVSFRVQLGAFKNEPPAEIKDNLDKIGNIQKEVTHSGLTRYTSGDFRTYEQAEAHKQKIASQFGVTDAFIVSFFKGQIIPVPEAIELLK